MTALTKSRRYNWLLLRFVYDYLHGLHDTTRTDSHTTRSQQTDGPINGRIVKKVIIPSPRKTANESSIRRSSANETHIVAFRLLAIWDATLPRMTSNCLPCVCLSFAYGAPISEIHKEWLPSVTQVELLVHILEMRRKSSVEPLKDFHAKSFFDKSIVIDSSGPLWSGRTAATAYLQYYGTK